MTATEVEAEITKHFPRLQQEYGHTYASGWAAGMRAAAKGEK
jgi:hypothetical protein